MINRTLFLLLAMVLFTGCQAVQELPGLGNQAKTHVGQLRYAMRRRTVVGDFVLRFSSNGDYDLAFSKADMTVLQLQAHGSQLTATGLLARGGWTGSIDHVPGALRTWARLKQVIPYFDANQTTTASGNRWTASFDRSGGTLARCEIHFKSGETFDFKFSQ